jgi:hypothetical protein
LETSTVVGEFPDLIQSEVNDLFSNGVSSSCKIVCGILFSGQEGSRAEKSAICSGSDLIDHSGFKIDHESTGDELARGGLSEESASGVIPE